MFAGVGGFRAGLDLAGGFQCIGHCEIDKYADTSYHAIHAPGKEEVYYPDAVETFLMSLFYEGRIGCFEPVTYLSRSGVTQIRPMLYIGEKAIEHFAQAQQLPVVRNVCPADKHTKRQEIKELIASLQTQYPDIKTRIFGAMQRYPLSQWSVQK